MSELNSGPFTVSEATPPGPPSPVIKRARPKISCPGVEDPNLTVEFVSWISSAPVPGMLETTPPNTPTSISVAVTFEPVSSARGPERATVAGTVGDAVTVSIRPRV